MPCSFPVTTGAPRQSLSDRLMARSSDFNRRSVNQHAGNISLRRSHSIKSQEEATRTYLNQNEKISDPFAIANCQAEVLRTKASIRRTQSLKSNIRTPAKQLANGSSIRADDGHETARLGQELSFGNTMAQPRRDITLAPIDIGHVPGSDAEMHAGVLNTAFTSAEAFALEQPKSDHVLRKGIMKKRIVSKRIYWAPRHVTLTKDRCVGT